METVNPIKGPAGLNPRTDASAAAAGPHPAGNPLLTGPVLPTLLRLAVPNVLAMTMAVLVGIAETYYIGLLGVEPLAAMTAEAERTSRTWKGRVHRQPVNRTS